MGFHCLYSVEAVSTDVDQAGLAFPTSGNPPVLASQSAGITGVHHYTQLIFVFLVEMGFRHVG